MREIQFRGKTKDGKWVYGHYNEWENVSRISGIVDGEFDNVRVIPETVGQYTGFHDKNGTKIFEGDILGGFGIRKLEIYYDTTHCQFRAAENGGCNREIDYYCGYPIRFEVIGNIHDNPELLNT